MFVFALGLVTVGCSGLVNDNNQKNNSNTDKGETMAKKTTKKAAKKTTKKTTKKTESQTPRVKLTTNFGEIIVELNLKEAPISTKNFLGYVKSGFYDGVIFHRVIPNFMVQTGGFDKDMNDKDRGTPIKNEADNGLKNLRGTLSMARTAEIDSATSQFFINLKDNSFLDHGSRDFGYAVFGKVIEGMDVVDKIAEVKTGRSGFHDDVPLETVIIEKAELLK